MAFLDQHLPFDSCLLYTGMSPFWWHLSVFSFSLFQIYPCTVQAGLAFFSCTNYEELQLKRMQEPRWHMPRSARCTLRISRLGRQCFPSLPGKLCTNTASRSVLKYWETLKSLLGARRDSTALLQLPVSAQQGATQREASDLLAESFLSRRYSLSVLAASHSHFSSLSRSPTERLWRTTPPSRHV